jgi:SAM-dependent methyltransferase
MAFQGSRVLLTAYELGVFTALGQGPRSSEQVARALGTDPRATDRLLRALCVLGLARRRDEAFENTEAGSRHLVRGEPGRGGSVLEGGLDGRGPDWIHAFIEAMHQRARDTAPRIVGSLDLTGVRKVLDVGGGSGVYAMAFARAADDVTVTVFDLPAVIPLTREYVCAAGLQDRIELVEGDYTADAFGEGFDLVFLSAILHINSPQGNQALLHKAASALRPGGQIAVLDFIMAEDRSDPPFGAMFALNMLVGTPAGDTYTEAEIRGWLEAAGMNEVQRLERDGMAEMIVARRPAR